MVKIKDVIRFQLQFKLNINWNHLIDLLSVAIIKNKAYDGYCYLCSLKSMDALPKENFYKFDCWKIHLSYMSYLYKNNLIEEPYSSYNGKWCLKQYFRL